MTRYFYIILPIFLLSCSKQDPEPLKSFTKSIRTFSLNSLNPPVSATLDSIKQTITATFPIGTDISKLVPTITISDKATISPASGIVQDFSKPVSYTVVAEDGSTRVYTTKVSVLKSSARSILNFSFQGLIPAVTATIDTVNRIIMATVPRNTDLTKLMPTIIFSGRATLSPVSGVVHDFSKAVVYTITAESGETRTYTAQVSTAKSSAKFIKSFYFDDLFPNGVATVDTVARTIMAVVPVGTNLAKLKPTIVVADKATASPSSGTELNFLDRQTFTVTAENGSKQNYTADVRTIAEKPLDVLLYGSSYTWKKTMCTLQTYPYNIFRVILFEKDMTCADTKYYSFGSVSFDIPISGLGTFYTSAYFNDPKSSTSSSYFYSIVQVTKITDTTIEGKIIAGNRQGGNFIEGKFVAQLCL